MTRESPGSLSALLVSPDAAARAVCQRVLQEEDWTVDAVSLFETGRMLLHRSPPALLVVSERLGAFNGFHLAILARFESPPPTTVVIGEGRSESESRAAGSHYLVRPTFAADLAGLLRRIRGGAPPGRQWQRTLVRGDCFAAVKGATGPLLDVSYGGMRLVIAGALGTAATAHLEVALVGRAHHVQVRPIWHRLIGPRTEYGLSLSSPGAAQDDAWRQLVDHLRVGR